MTNANPTPTQPQIIIQKNVIVINQNPILFFPNQQLSPITKSN
jgi:hypothetical protein